MILLASLLALTLLSAAAVIPAIVTAPKGYEDDSGFHFGNPGERPVRVTSHLPAGPVESRHAAA